MILRPYFLSGNEPSSDTLSVVGAALVRQTPRFGTATLEERYERR